MFTPDYTPQLTLIPHNPITPVVPSSALSLYLAFAINFPQIIDAVEGKIKLAPTQWNSRTKPIKPLG
jgi:hypothetical protein